MKTALYIIACLVVPPLWGWIASTVYDRIYSRPMGGADTKSGVDMYHI